MFSTSEKRQLGDEYFIIIREEERYIEVKSKNTGHCWMIFKKYPQIKIVLQNIFLNLVISAEVIFKKSYIKDIQDISIVVSSATVFPNGILKIELIDGSRMKITL